MKIEKIAVIGCGAMGAGISQVVLQAGYELIVRELDENLLNKGLGKIRGSLEKLVSKKLIAEEAANSSLKRLHGTVSLDPLADCDLIIEAVFEDLQVKMDQFKALDKICKKGALIASNTSSLSITQMAAATSRKESFLGMHFFQPATVMPLVEVVRTIAVSPELIDAALVFVRSLGKVPILARDQAGFIVNRLLTPFMLDAMRAASGGIASIEDIDSGMKLGLNHPMGPLMLADYIGLDLILHAGEVMFEEFREGRFAPPPVLRKMVLMGYLGIKTERGFYDWSDPKNPKPLKLSA
ncbi:MAG: 3-hydroxybutyryl-CoA dehydrogenase [Deltaproteobacteria bacterium HGW-Deltaproteobacteria-21]|nr:MAG: 3-hydroxybutyryl-CoA dehydrogenase [Deltaproteobacteria bacterium HGW-Deltaproteobacteria-21]